MSGIKALLIVGFMIVCFWFYVEDLFGWGNEEDDKE
jgi:hypothetical protein